ncbi:MAG: hypothetical protein EU981_04095 [Candidatus Liberibacter ctenarytainae]|uniref:Uncharacterized protein n=1 Tax=Candidatus Liberibacter ctenarytainae TaxID=2020335 RepID=A0A937DLI1_9HYPH|nr:hypothetical protein [Candidatus Liberibacter ctenarytainae]
MLSKSGITLSITGTVRRGGLGKRRLSLTTPSLISPLTAPSLVSLPFLSVAYLLSASSGLYTSKSAIFFLLRF